MSFGATYSARNAVRDPATVPATNANSSPDEPVSTYSG